MRMITLFMPEAYLQRADDLVKQDRFPNRSEAFRHMIMNYLDKEFGGKPIPKPGDSEQEPEETQEEEVKPVAASR